MGFNRWSMLGTGTNIDSLVPLQITSNVASIAGWLDATVFVKTDGTLGAPAAMPCSTRIPPFQLATNVAGAAIGLELVHVTTDPTLRRTADTSGISAITTDVALAAVGRGHIVYGTTDGNRLGDEGQHPRIVG